MQKRVHIFGYTVVEHGVGEFGMIYSGISRQEAVVFLSRLKSGEVKNALYHAEIGYIDLVFGLAHIIEKHPEIVENLHTYVCKSEILQKSKDRIILLYDPNIKSIISLTWHNFDKNWLVTAYEKIPG